MSGFDDLRARLRVVANLRRDSNLRSLGLAYVGYKLTELASWIVILVFAYERGGVIESGVVAAVMFVPSSLIVPFASMIGDRFSRSRALSVAYLLTALSAAACAAALALELSGLLVYVTMLVLCVGISLCQPLQMSALVALAETAEDVTAANVVNGLIESASYFAGPLLAALLLPWTGAWAVFVVLACTMLVSAFVASGMITGDAVRDAPRRLETHELWQDFARSVRGVLVESDAALLMGLMAGHELLIGAIDVLFVAIAFDLLETGDSGAALLNAAFGLGLLGGALLSVTLVGSHRIGTWLVSGGALAGVPLILLAGVRVEPLALALLACAGIGTLLSEVATRTLFQRVIPPYRITQTFGVLESVGLIALTVGTLGTAGLISQLGVDRVLIALGVVLAAVAGLAYLPIRRLESRYGPPPPQALEALLGLPIFRPLGALAIEQLARSAVFAEASPGDLVIRQGDECGPFFVLLDGRVEAQIDGFPVRTHGPGEYFGEISALHGIARTATVVARTPVRMLELDPELFVQAVSSHPKSLAIVRGVATARAAGLRSDGTRRPLEGGSSG